MAKANYLGFDVTNSEVTNAAPSRYLYGKQYSQGDYAKTTYLGQTPWSVSSSALYPPVSTTLQDSQQQQYTNQSCLGGDEESDQEQEQVVLQKTNNLFSNTVILNRQNGVQLGNKKAKLAKRKVVANSTAQVQAQTQADVQADAQAQADSQAQADVQTDAQAQADSQAQADVQTQVADKKSLERAREVLKSTKISKLNFETVTK